MSEHGTRASGVGRRRRHAIELRGQAFLALAATCLLALVGRLCYIHAEMARDGTRLSAHLTQQQQSTIPVPARRGDILDARGRLLAGSQERPSIYVDPALIEDLAAESAELARVLAPTAEQASALAQTIRQQIVKACESGAKTGREVRFVWIQRGADVPQGERIRQLIHDKKLSGTGVTDEPYRRYPMNHLAAHVIGFVDIDGVGREGIERRYDETLRGAPGSMTIYRDARRRPMWPGSGDEAYVPPRDGMSLRLTIDAVIQEAVEAQVAAAVEHFKAESGVGLVMNPKTGDVLAMANVPTYDPNRLEGSTFDDRRNRAITDPCEPGSTFKGFVASAALAEKVVKPGEIIFCHNGTYVVGTRRLNDHHPYGDLTFEQIVIKSSNIGMAILGERLGNQRMHRYLSAPSGFGFGSRTGIDLDGEDPGILLPLRKWTSYSTRSVPMGQEIALTPLQLATGFCTLVNGGLHVRPRIVSAILDPRGSVVREFTARDDMRRVLPADVADFIARTVLVGVVNEGTGQKARLDEYQVLGKTGTAQIARRNGGGYLPDAYTSSFVGAAPASDPTVVVLVMIRKPKKSIGYYGGTVSAPAVREVFRRALAYLDVPPDKAPPAKTSSPKALVRDMRD